MARLDSKLRHIALMVACTKIGRPLKPDEYVKVIDPTLEITEDNVMIFRTKGDMSKYNTNRTGKYIFTEGEDKLIDVKLNPNSPFVKVCPVCGKQFVLNDLMNDKTCCSKECSYTYQRKGARREYIALGNSNIDFTNKRIPQIRAIAGVKIGRQLLESEYPYPLDGNHNNLNPENIVVLTSISDYYKMIHGAPGKYKLVLNPDGITHRVEETNPTSSSLIPPVNNNIYTVYNDGNNQNTNASNITLYDSETSYRNSINYHQSEVLHTVNSNINHYEPLKQVVEIHREGHERYCKYCGSKFYVMDSSNPRQFCNSICRSRWVAAHPTDNNIMY